MRMLAIESLVVEGESNAENQMTLCDIEQDFHPPFALFCPDLQCNVAGPFAAASHAYAAKETMLAGRMVPYDNHPSSIWTVGGKPSPWYGEGGGK